MNIDTSDMLLHNKIEDIRFFIEHSPHLTNTQKTAMLDKIHNLHRINSHSFLEDLSNINKMFEMLQKEGPAI